MKSLGFDLINNQSLDSKPNTSFFVNPLGTKKSVDVDPDVIYKPEVVNLAESMIQVLKSNEDKSEFLKGFQITKNRDQSLRRKSTETLSKRKKTSKTASLSSDSLLNIFKGSQNTLEVPAENNAKSISVPNLNESNSKAMVMIFVIGGITPSEIRYFLGQFEFSRQY